MADAASTTHSTELSDLLSRWRSCLNSDAPRIQASNKFAEEAFESIIPGEYTQLEPSPKGVDPYNRPKHSIHQRVVND